VRGHRWGDNEKIIYLSSSTQFGSFVKPLLDAGFAVVAYDTLSHGSSDAGPSGLGRSNALEHRDVLKAAWSQRLPCVMALSPSVPCTWHR
jgi:hypothetical protein